MAGEIIRLGDSTSHGGTVIEGSMTDICHGKPIAYVGHKVHWDVPKQAAAAALAVPGKKNAETANNTGDKEKNITRIFWTYGADETPVAEISRHYVDLNLHVETVNYAAGERALVVVATDDGSELLVGSTTLELQVTIGADGTAKSLNVFKGRTLQIGTIG